MLLLLGGICRPCRDRLASCFRAPRDRHHHAAPVRLAALGPDVSAVEVLCGEQGARILDEHGRYHGLRARIVRAFQRLGYDETTLAIYDEALRKGDLLLHVPAQPPERRRIVELLQRHHVHDVGYFAPGTFEQFPILDAD